VIADDDDVELVVVEGYFINTASNSFHLIHTYIIYIFNLFLFCFCLIVEVRPGFAGRFFRYLAAIIAERIQSRETLLYE